MGWRGSEKSERSGEWLEKWLHPCHHQPLKDHHSAKARREAERKNEVTNKNLKSLIHLPRSNKSKETKSGSIEQASETAPLRVRTTQPQKWACFVQPRRKRIWAYLKNLLNTHIKRMEYRDRTTAHEFRRLTLTTGPEVLKVDHAIIQPQMGTYPSRQDPRLLWQASDDGAETWIRVHSHTP